MGVPRPSYSSVRRIVIAERERKLRHRDELDLPLRDLLRGRFPTAFVEHKVIGLRSVRGRFEWEDYGLELRDG